MSTVWLDGTDRTFLLGVARRAIGAWLLGEPLPFEQAPSRLREPRGVFVSLHRRGNGELRGCIGSTRPHALVEAVARAAVAAATMDDRFGPVRPDELETLVVQLSILDPPFPVGPEEVQAGTHGVIVRCGEASGLLLPQVAPEHGWGPDRLLEMACRKAGLPADAWRRPDIELLAFTATVFGEECGLDAGQARRTTLGGPDRDEDWRATVAGMIGRLPGPKGERFARALAHGTLSVEMYAPRASDGQQPHTQDELYVVVQGRGWLVKGVEHVRVGAGDVLFVPAGEAHRFEDFSDDLLLWAIFFGPEGGER